MATLESVLGCENLPTSGVTLSAFVVEPFIEGREEQLRMVGASSIQVENRTEMSTPLHGWVLPNDHPSRTTALPVSRTVNVQDAVAGVMGSIGGKWTTRSQQIPDNTIIRIMYTATNRTTRSAGGKEQRNFYILVRDNAAHRTLSFPTSRVAGKSRIQNAHIYGRFDLLTPAVIFSDYGIVTQSEKVKLYGGYSENHLQVTMSQRVVTLTTQHPQVAPRPRVETTLVLSNSGESTFVREKKRTRAFR